MTIQGPHPRVPAVPEGQGVSRPVRGSRAWRLRHAFRTACVAMGQIVCLIVVLSAALDLAATLIVHGHPLAVVFELLGLMFLVVFGGCYVFDR